MLNGLVGNYLARTQNGLATEMAFCRSGAPVRADRDGLADYRRMAEKWWGAISSYVH